MLCSRTALNNLNFKKFKFFHAKTKEIFDKKILLKEKS